MFYVYGLFEIDEDEIKAELPFYIGKTCNLLKREQDHRYCADNDYEFYVYNKIRKLLREGKDFALESLFQFEDEQTCLEKEIELIEQYGRKIDDDSNSLYNLTAGGEGHSLYTQEEVDNFIAAFEESNMSAFSYCKDKVFAKSTFIEWLRLANKEELIDVPTWDKYTQEEIDDILSDFEENGMSVTSYCKDKVFGRTSLTRWLRLADKEYLIHVAPRNKYSEETKKMHVKQFLQSNLSQRKYAKLHCIPHQTLSLWIRKYKTQIETEKC